ncbi:MAG: tetratricopeptide repeat protein [Lentisphaerae bacterium]|nr:MAG: tetratricopeptide repeat protein [Lentisphaerota bacterium]
MTNRTVFSVTLWDIYQKEGREELERGNLEKARERFLAALEKAQAYGPNEPRIATTKRYLGLVAQRLKQYDEARRYYEEALELLEQQVGQKSPSLLKLLIAYKTLLRECGETNRLEAIDEKIEAIRREAEETLGTTDLFEEEVPANADEIPMSNEQALRIQELLNRPEVPEEVRQEVEMEIRDNPSYLWAHQTQARLRQIIVESYRPGSNQT